MLEDTHLDILGKAQRGLGLSDQALCEHASVSVAELKQVRAGKSIDDAILTALAKALNLAPHALLAIAHGTWQPQPASLDGLQTFTTAYGDMTVNAYLCHAPGQREAVLFDTGADATPILDYLHQQQLRLSLILITHTHSDHIAALPRLTKETNAPAWVNHREPLSGAQSFREGHTFEHAGLHIETRLTAGHATGGITYVVQGLPRPLAIVGDALFAGSIGGPKISYTQALETNRQSIFSLPDDTLLAPGHGPLTTVAEEKAHNPFHAQLK